MFSEKLYNFWKSSWGKWTIMFSGVEKINNSMVEIQDYTQQLKNTADSLNNQLTSLKNQISSTLNNCPAALTTDCDGVRSTVDSTSIKPDFNMVSSHRLNTIELSFTLDSNYHKWKVLFCLFCTRGNLVTILRPLWLSFQMYDVSTQMNNIQNLLSSNPSLQEVIQRVIFLYIHDSFILMNFRSQ